MSCHDFQEGERGRKTEFEFSALREDLADPLILLGFKEKWHTGSAFR
jgi:hypothetical protein